MAPRPALTVQLLTLEEAAAALHATISVSTLRAALRDGRLPRRKIGRRYFVTPAEIEEFLACPAPESLPGSTTARTSGSGSSAMAPGWSGQAAALASVKRLRALSANTSDPDLSPLGEVLPLHRS